MSIHALVTENMLPTTLKIAYVYKKKILNHIFHVINIELVYHFEVLQSKKI